MNFFLCAGDYILQYMGSAYIALARNFLRHINWAYLLNTFWPSTDARSVRSNLSIECLHLAQYAVRVHTKWVSRPGPDSWFRPLQNMARWPAVCGLNKSSGIKSSIMERHKAARVEH